MKIHFFLLVVLTLCAGNALKAQTAVTAQPMAKQELQIDPSNWPAQQAADRDQDIESRVADLLKTMTLEEKVGQVIQADISSVTPEDVKKYSLGSVLNGGNSAPGGDVRADAKKWLELVDKMWVASTDRSDGGLGIPLLWGTDAVHGHNNIVGATIFPHNIGLGAANNPELIAKIASVTAREVAVTGIDWTFAPTLAVVRDDRWGRTYESYSESPEIVAAYASQFVEGLQGKLHTDQYLNVNGKVLGTAKHFVGDGGTTSGKDQGDTTCTEVDLRDIHAAGYPAAIRSGIQVIMASFNSYQGKKLHGYAPLLSSVLRDRMGFDGFVVGDWNGHAQVAGCSPTSGAACFNAGLDMFMAPDTWKGLYETTLSQVKSGEISQQRLDEAVSRILRVKLRSGLFENGLPSSRPLAGKFELLGCQEHLAVARQAVRESLVLLKNNDVLPIKSNSRVLVVGTAADDMGIQCGGWTYSWQGTGNQKQHFPHGTTIFGGLKSAVEAAGGSCELSVDGTYTDKPDVAVVVFGETPYAEFTGDQANLEFGPETGLKLLEKYQDQGIPTVGVFVTGRPLYVNPEINASDAFVVAWLPGIAGRGVADVLVADAQDQPQYDFRGRLSFSWPRSPYQEMQNVGSEDYSPLFAYGFGLSYATTSSAVALPVDFEAPANPQEPFLIKAGEMQSSASMMLIDQDGETPVGGAETASTLGALSVKRVDGFAQEDTLEINWIKSGAVSVRAPQLPLNQENVDQSTLRMVYRLAPGTDVNPDIVIAASLVPNQSFHLSELKSEQMDNGWQAVQLKLKDVAQIQGANRILVAISISSVGPAKIHVNSLRVVGAN